MGYRVVYEGKPGAIGCSANRDWMNLYVESEEAARAWMARHLPDVVIVEIRRLPYRRADEAC